jgi:hypothetical protein
MSQSIAASASISARAGHTTLKAVLVGCALAFAGIAAASTPPHTTVMQGQILSVEDDGIVLCIGTEHGASVGQVLEVVRHVRTTRAPKAAGPGFRREHVGQIRIAELFDEHYSRADVVSGSPQVHDSAEVIPAR